jgi:hypothetical protein
MRIFLDLIKNTMKVFNDNFSVYGTSFDEFLINLLSKVLRRCKDINLMLN